MKMFFSGLAGQLEGYYSTPQDTPPEGMALVLHPHSEHGGSMNNKIVYNIFHAFKEANFAVMRFNFRGVGRSEGIFDKGIGELNDAVAALNWLNSQHEHVDGPKIVSGYSFGAWIGMQLFMRRPDISKFIIVAPPISLFDFNFLAPCPSPGLVIYGNHDPFTPQLEMPDFIKHLEGPKKNSIKHVCLEDADHYFREYTDEIKCEVAEYVEEIRLSKNY